MYEQCPHYLVRVRRCSGNYRSNSLEPRRRDGGRSAQDATATPAITIGYAAVSALINPDAQSDATAPVKSKSTPVCPLFQSGKPRNHQRYSAERFPDARDDQEVRRITQTLDELTHSGHSQNIPYASQNQFEDGQSSGHPVSNGARARSETGAGEFSHGVSWQLRPAETSAGFAVRLPALWPAPPAQAALPVRAPEPRLRPWFSHNAWSCR